MKQPSRMLMGDFTGKLGSSAFDLRSSDFIEPSYGTHGSKSGSQLVSNRYNRRRASAQSVTFKIPEVEEIRCKDSTFGGTLTGTISDEESVSDKPDYFDWGFRRMSAPELPPISPNGKNSALINNGFLTSRSNTFHNYKFKTESKGTRKSIHSDSSVSGYLLTANSRTSSSSSHKSRGRVLSAGTDRHTKQTITPDDIKELIQKPPFRLEVPSMRNGMTSTVSTPRSSSVTGTYSRTRTKVITGTSRKLVHCGSESQISGSHIANQNGRNNEKGGLKRNVSDQCLENRNNLNNNRLNNIQTDRVGGGSSTSPAAKQGKPAAQTNGIRKFPSSLGLSSVTKDDRKSDEDARGENSYDSDSDSEKDQRVLEWIIGVDKVAEPPEEPLIDYSDEPPQRDTAIRIVYEGDL